MVLRLHGPRLPGSLRMRQLTKLLPGQLTSLPSPQEPRPRFLALVAVSGPRGPRACATQGQNSGMGHTKADLCPRQQATITPPAVSHEDWSAGRNGTRVCQHARLEKKSQMLVLGTEDGSWAGEAWVTAVVSQVSAAKEFLMQRHQACGSRADPGAQALAGSELSRAGRWPGWPGEQRG